MRSGIFLSLIGFSLSSIGIKYQDNFLSYIGIVIYIIGSVYALIRENKLYVKLNEKAANHDKTNYRYTNNTEFSKIPNDNDLQS